MEQKDIRYTGITQAVSDLDCSDGDLSISHNVINHNGAMRPIILPEPEFVLHEGEKLLYIHSTSENKNYILLSNRKIDNHIHVYRDAIVCQYPTRVKIHIVIHENHLEDDKMTVDSLDIPAGTSKMNCLYSNIIKVLFALDPIDDEIYEYSIGFTDRNYQESDEGHSNIQHTTTRRLCFFHPESPALREDFHYLENKEIYKIESIGNTLIVLFDSGIEYMLLIDKHYKSLGQKPPELSISFGLEGILSKTPTTKIDMGNNNIPWSNDGTEVYFDVATKEQVSNQIKPLINTFINNATSRGMFVFPFFVRYAYRTFEGSYMQSPPVLLIPNTGRFPYIPASNTETTNNILKKMDISIVGYICQMNYRIYNFESVIEHLKMWSDIINSVDIYISAPIYSYDQDGQCLKVSSLSISTIGGYYPIGNGYLTNGIEVNGEKIYGKVKPSNYGLEVIGPYVDRNIFYERIRETSVFRKIKTFDINDLKSSDSIVIDADTMNALNVQETLIDDYNSHDKLIPKYSFVYNSRLNIGNISKAPFAFPTESLVTYTNGTLSNNTGEKKTYEYRIYTFIKDNGREVLVSNSNNVPLYEAPMYLFYPNPNATRMIIERKNKDGKKMYAELPLVEHKFLNGSYYFNDFGDIVFKSDFKITTLENRDVYIDEKNKIYTSELRNPFFFPLEGINTIGVGEIVGLSSTTKALSQGQFGQFPLLVFSSDGIWAMEVSSNGLYSVKQPMSRDVCSNPASITQIDGAVIFISDKGVMMVNGAEVTTFSSELDGTSFYHSSVLRLDEIVNKEELKDELLDYVSLKEFFAGCEIAYDYPNSRLFLINKAKSYAYVYSLESRSWGTISSSFMNVVTDYPNSYVQKKDGEIINISSKENFDIDSRVKYAILSRPVKLDGDMYKTLNTVINRGMFIQKDMAIVVFASTDGIRYFPIGSAKGSRLSRLQGSAFRYFRVLTVGNMSSKESLSATSLYYTPKWRNKPR